MLDFERLAALLILLVTVFGGIERVWGLHPQKLLRRAFGTDLAYYFLSGLVPKFLLILPLTALAAVAHRLFGGALYEAAARLPLGLRLLAAAVVSDIGAYWGHRWSHEIGWLWRFHSVHHSAEEMDWLVNSRAHPVDLVFTRLCSYVPMYLLGLAQPLGTAQMDLVPALVAFLGTLWGFFIHSNLRWRFRGIEWIVSTPAFHHWHHTNDSADRLNKNYAAMLPWVDGLFGTLYLPSRQWPAKYGTDTPVSADLAGQLIQPFQSSSPASSVTPKWSSNADSAQS